MEADDYLKSQQVNGEVSTEAFEQAVSIMLAKGATADETLEFLIHSSLLINMDADNARSRIMRIKQRIEDSKRDQWLIEREVDVEDRWKLDFLHGSKA